MSASDLDRRLGIVSCRHCGAIYDLTRVGRPPTDAADSPPVERKESLDRAPAAMPHGFTVEKGGSDLLRIRWRWFKPMALFLVFFCVVWNGILIGVYSLGTSTDAGLPFIVYLFPLGHVAVGLGLTYYTVALFLNRTTVTVKPHELRVRHAPLPWSPSHTIPVRDLEQLYVERKVTHTKNGTDVTFQLMAVTRAHTGRELIGGLSELDQALYLEQEIESVLGLRDRPVAGEHREDGVQL
jgi:hypothetical protein